MEWFLLLVGKIVVSLVGAWVIFIIGAVIYGWVGWYLPICMQGPLFRMYQKALIKSVCDDPNVSPLIKFPFAVWVEFTLPTIFKQKGLKGCKEAAIEWGNEFERKLKESIKVGDVVNPPHHRVR